MEPPQWTLAELLDEVAKRLQESFEKYRAKLEVEEVGRLTYVGHGTARVAGLPRVQSQELVRFPGDRFGLAFNLDPEEVGVVLLDRGEGIAAGATVRRTHRVLDVPVGDALVGRIVDGLGRPIDGVGPIHATARRPVERPAPAIMDRAPVTVPLQTGIKVIDALIPIGRGQRQLILGDRQTGKTAIALDAIVNQRDTGVICIYCAIGQRSASVARVVDDLRRCGAMRYSVVVATTEERPPGEQFVAAYSAMSIAEYFMERGEDVLLVLDDLTRHARAYRELSLLLRRPPGREAYPGDIFYIHSRLLERSTHLRGELGGGSITALPIVETEAQNISGYIPTNIISITDGQVYLSPELFDKGILPAVDVGKSVSRVGGKTQLAAYRSVAGDLRLAYAQFEELEAFARFGTRLDPATRKILERGRRVREILKQPQYEPLPVAQQIAVLIAVNAGVLDEIPLAQVPAAERLIRQAVAQLPEVISRIESGQPVTDQDRGSIVKIAMQAIAAFAET
ncbi:MAG: alternate F1F0 ATPase, F1 subunit alpha [Pirellulaceae bacterium]|nr:MAG: alternate F1F0 ATPase, F1 subunit alpha [Pirellulaceae bacterium]